MNRPKMARPTALQLLEPARLTRQRVEEFAPMVLFAPRSGQPKMAVVDEPGVVADVVAALLAQMRAELGPADWISVTTDAYVKTFADVPTIEDQAPGALREAFEEGDLEVREQMIVLLVDRYKGVEVASQNYRYIPSEGWEWDEPVEETPVDGALIKVVKHYM